MKERSPTKTFAQLALATTNRFGTKAKNNCDTRPVILVLKGLSHCASWLLRHFSP